MKTILSLIFTLFMAIHSNAYAQDDRDTQDSSSYEESDTSFDDVGSIASDNDFEEEEEVVETETEFDPDTYFGEEETENQEPTEEVAKEETEDQEPTKEIASTETNNEPAQDLTPAQLNRALASQLSTDGPDALGESEIAEGESNVDEQARLIGEQETSENSNVNIARNAAHRHLQNYLSNPINSTVNAPGLKSDHLVGSGYQNSSLGQINQPLSSGISFYGNNRFDNGFGLPTQGFFFRNAPTGWGPQSI